jgi:PAS domain S-box-containing protein
VRDGVNKKESEEALVNTKLAGELEIQQRYRQWSAVRDEVLWIVDWNRKRLIYVSPAYETIWGRTLTDLHENPDDWLNGVYPEDRRRVERLSGACPTSGGFDVEYRVVHPDGKTRWVRHSSFPIYDDEGRVFRVASLAVDITQSKKAEDMLQSECDLAETLIQTANVAVLVFDTAGRIVRFNPYMERLSGYKLEEVKGRKWITTFFPQDEKDRIRDYFSRTIEDAPTQGNVNAILTKDGQKRLIEWRNTVLEDDHGEKMGLLAIGIDVTEHMREDDRIRQREERFRLMVETLPEGAVFVDGNGNIQLNKAAEEITGYKRSELATIDECFEKLYGDENLAVRRFYEKERRAGFPAPRTMRVIRKDGQRRDIEFSSCEDERGAIWLLRDVTERRLAREALIQRTRELDERVKELRCLYSIADLVETPGITLAGILQGTVDLIPRSLHYPQIACARIVLDTREFRTKSFKETPWKLASDVAIKGVRAGVLETFYMERRPDLDEGPFLKEERNLIDAVAERLGRIIERHRAEERQRLSETVVEQAAESIIVMDTEGKIEYVNPAFERVSGYTRNEILGRHPRFLREVDKDLYEQLWETIRGGEVWEGRLVSRRKDGTRYEEEGTITPVRDERSEIVRFVTVMRDVTEMVKLETSLRQAQKMEAIGQLAGGVAHDFNNLLTVILTNSHYLLRAVDESSPLRQDIEEIKQSGDRAAALTRQLLAFSRMQVLEPRVVDLNQVLEGTEKMLRRLIGEDIELSSVRAPDLGRVFVDPAQIEQVVLNLAVNARDAMPSGGKLALETSNVFLDEAYARSREDVNPGWYVMLAVSDTGCGMDENTLSRIFEPFFTTKRTGKGTGLGLATVYGIVKQGGGHIWVYSEVDKGTVFKIYFPRVGMEERPEGERAVSSDSLLGSETILVVEDDELVRRTAVRILREHRYVVHEASSGEEALEICERHSGDIDLMLSDVVMPKMSGGELASLVAAKYPAIKVIFMSGYTENGRDHFDEADSSGVFVQKPLIPIELARKVHEVLEGKAD